MDKNHRAPIRDYLLVHQYAGKNDFNVRMPNSSDLNHPFKFLGVHHANPSEDEINKVLTKMGKTSKDKELNCGSCGYETCREKAKAIMQVYIYPGTLSEMGGDRFSELSLIHVAHR